jgi:hypothetical protein
VGALLVFLFGLYNGHHNTPEVLNNHSTVIQKEYFFQTTFACFFFEVGGFRLTTLHLSTIVVCGMLALFLAVFLRVVFLSLV